MNWKAFVIRLMSPKILSNAWAPNKSIIKEFLAGVNPVTSAWLWSIYFLAYLVHTAVCCISRPTCHTPLCFVFLGPVRHLSMYRRAGGVCVAARQPHYGSHQRSLGAAGGLGLRSHGRDICAGANSGESYTVTTGTWKPGEGTSRLQDICYSEVCSDC